MKPSTPYALSPALSIYLDLVRFAAALTVFVAHFRLHRLSGGFLWQLNPYGDQAVTALVVRSMAPGRRKQAWRHAFEALWPRRRIPCSPSQPRANAP